MGRTESEGGWDIQWGSWKGESESEEGSWRRSVRSLAAWRAFQREATRRELPRRKTLGPGTIEREKEMGRSEE